MANSADQIRRTPDISISRSPNYSIPNSLTDHNTITNKEPELGFTTGNEIGAQKRSRSTYEFTASKMRDRFNIPSENKMISEKNSYAKKVKPKDVKFNEIMSLDEREKIRVHQPSEDDPFMSIDFTDDLEELMCKQWRDTILIKMLGKPWCYPNLVNKLSALWKSTDGCDFIDLGFGCYCLKGITTVQRDLILTQGPWQVAGSFLSLRKMVLGFSCG